MTSKTCSWGRGEHQKTPQEGGTTPSSLLRSGARHVAQSHCIFTMDYVASRPPTLEICSDSRRRLRGLWRLHFCKCFLMLRSGHCKNAVIDRAPFSSRTSAAEKRKERIAASIAPSTHSTHSLDSLVPTSDFSLLTSHFSLRTSHFALLASQFPLLTSPFSRLTSLFPGCSSPALVM